MPSIGQSALDRLSQDVIVFNEENFHLQPL
jgi:hypothetical protein